MPLDSVQIKLQSQSDYRVSYRICNRHFYTNKKIDALRAFEVKPEQFAAEDSRIDTRSRASTINEPKSQLLFTGSSWLAGKDRKLSCSRTNEGFLIKVPQVANFLIAADQARISQLNSGNDQVSNTVFEEILLGPPLMLTLAINQLFALHASAVMVNNKAVLFVGRSGYGKSTLAHWLNELTPLTRLSDDISVLENTSKEFQFLPDFLQMKLPDCQQHANTPAIELGAIVLLNRKVNETVALSQLDTLSSIQALVNHSVAAQLFDKPLAQQHLTFMSELTQNLPVYTLNYPDGQEFTKTIAEILTKQIN